MEKSNKENNKNFNLSFEQEKLLKKYLEEYKELYQKILILSPEDFIQSLTKRVEITLKDKFNGFSQNSKTVVENLIIEKIYSNEYKYALFVKRIIQQRNSLEITSHIFNDEIIPHCENDKKDNYYIHTCGKRFQTFKYKPIAHLPLIFNNNNNQNSKECLLYCEECDMIYKSDLIKFKCYSSKEDFYSKLIDKNERDNYQIATWKKYHCNIIINDAMKCQICNENLYYLKEINQLFCINCKSNFDPKTLIWKCIKCKSDFFAEVKIFNPLEYKNMKICVKETILNKKKAKPTTLGCGCNYEMKNVKFFHKSSCNGELFLGELNDKKVVVCNKCESLGAYDGYVWTCPLCFKRFKNCIAENNENNKNEIKNEQKKDNFKNQIFNYSNSNWKVGNVLCYKSPTKIGKRFLLPSQNYSKEKEYQSDMKNIKYIRRNITPLNILGKERYPSGLPSPSKYLKDLENCNIIAENNFNNNKKVNIPKGNNFSPKKMNHESKLCYNLIPNSKNNINNKSPNLIKSNLDLSETKNYDQMFNKYFGGYKNTEITDSQNNNFIKNNNGNFLNNNIKENIYTDFFLGDKVILNNKYKKTIVNSYNKIINQPSISRNNSINDEIKKKRCNSNFNGTKLDMECYNPYINNIHKNNIIINNKIPIKKVNNIRTKIINYKDSSSTSPDSQREKSPKNNTRKNSNINEINKDIKNKKIIPNQLNLSNYIIKKQIGHGSFGQILLVEDKNGNQYALKKIIAASSNSIRKIKNELQILLDIQNSGQELNTINIYGILSTQLDLTTYALYVLMELAATDWEKEIVERKKAKNHYSEYELMSILFCLVKSLSILQKQNIAHRDIKPQNILILKDSNLKKIYKLADFGEAKELLKGDRPTNNQTIRGTELFMSPILFYALRGRKKIRYVKHNPYKSDVFSLGLCSLFAATLGVKCLYDIRELKSNISVYVVVEKYLRFIYSDNVINIISKMLDICENTRCDFIQLEKEFNAIGYY